MEELFEYLQSLYPLSPEIQAALVSRFTKETYRKNKPILREGEVCKWIGFVETGLVRICYDIPGSSEHILSFHKAGSMFCAVNSYATSLPSKVSVVSMDQTLLRKFRKSEMEWVCERYPAFNFHVRMIMEDQSSLLEDHYLLMTIPAKERFLNLQKNQSWLLTDKRIKGYHLADYLGIDKATFSRFRNGNQSKRNKTIQ